MAEREGKISNGGKQHLNLRGKKKWREKLRGTERGLEGGGLGDGEWGAMPNSGQRKREDVAECGLSLWSFVCWSNWAGRWLCCTWTKEAYRPPRMSAPPSSQWDGAVCCTTYLSRHTQWLEVNSDLLYMHNTSLQLSSYNIVQSISLL